MRMRVLVCGGRKYSNSRFFNKIMDQLHKEKKITKIIEGGANGADRLARRWANLNDIPNKTYNAQWEIFGKAAGQIRNKYMYDMELPDLVVAFPGGNGTAGMVSYARSNNAIVIEYKEEPQ